MQTNVNRCHANGTLLLIYDLFLAINYRMQIAFRELRHNDESFINHCFTLTSPTFGITDSSYGYTLGHAHKYTHSNNANNKNSKELKIITVIPYCFQFS